LKISNLNDLKIAANALQQCTQLESLHVRGLYLQTTNNNNNNNNNNTNANHSHHGRRRGRMENEEEDEDEESAHDNTAQQQQQSQQQQQLQAATATGGGCYDALLHALATLPRLRVLHLSQKEDLNKPPPAALPIDPNFNTTDASPSSIQEQQQQQASSNSNSCTITCDALRAFCRAVVKRLACLSLLNMGLHDAHCAVLQDELHHSSTLTSLILIDNPGITEIGNAKLLQLLQQNRSCFNSTFGTDSDTQYRAQQLTLLHLNRCGRMRYMIAAADDDEDATTAVDIGSSNSTTSRRRRRRRRRPVNRHHHQQQRQQQVQQQIQQRRPEQAWLQYLTKINETVPEELELDALYCAISENPDFIRHACVCAGSAPAAAGAAIVEDDSVEQKKGVQSNKNSLVVDPPGVGVLPVWTSSPETAAAAGVPAALRDAAIPSTISTTTAHHHHHHHSSFSLKMKTVGTGLEQQDEGDHNKDDDNEDYDNDGKKPVLIMDTTPTESTCSSAGLVSDLSSCGVEDNHNDDDDDDDEDVKVNEQDAQPPLPPPPAALVQDEEVPDDNDKHDDKDVHDVYINQIRRLESKLAQRERQLWMREQALQARMRRVLNREADLLQAEARIKKAVHQKHEYQKKNSSTDTNSNSSSACLVRPLEAEEEEEKQQYGLIFPAFNTGGTIYSKSQHRVKSPQKTKALCQHYQDESEYCETAAAPSKTMTNKDFSLIVTRTASLQPQDSSSSSSSLEGRDDVYQQHQQHVAAGDAAAVCSLRPGTATTTTTAAATAAAAALPCLFMMTTSSRQSVSSLLLDLEKQTTSTLEQVRDECWNLSMTSFFQ
jgi:hypothetical protein